MELNKIHHMNWLDNTLPDKSVQLIIADPPYHEIKGDFDFVWPDFAAYLEDVKKWTKEMKRVLADNGTLFYWGHAKKIAYAQMILDEDFNLLANMVWEKTECQTLRAEIDKMRVFAPVTERLLMYSNEVEGQDRAELNYTFQIGTKRCELMEPIVAYLIDEMKAAGLTPSKINKATNSNMATHWFARTSQWAMPTADWYAKLQKIFNGHLARPYQYLRKDYEELLDQYEALKLEYEELRRPFHLDTMISDVLHVSQESHISKGFDHETIKPVRLSRMLILACSRKGDTVAVPFAGSGTECACAAEDGRNFIGFDIDAKHVKTSNDRVAKILRQPKLF